MQQQADTGLRQSCKAFPKLKTKLLLLLSKRSFLVILDGIAFIHVNCCWDHCTHALVERPWLCYTILPPPPAADADANMCALLGHSPPATFRSAARSPVLPMFCPIAVYVMGHACQKVSYFLCRRLRAFFAPSLPCMYASRTYICRKVSFFLPPARIMPSVTFFEPPPSPGACRKHLTVVSAVSGLLFGLFCINEILPQFGENENQPVEAPPPQPSLFSCRHKVTAHEAVGDFCAVRIRPRSPFIPFSLFLCIRRCFESVPG